MNEKLTKLYAQCLTELKSIGINMQEKEQIGEIQISISQRNAKRYGVCKQEAPDLNSKYIEKRGRRKIIKYFKYNKHKIEISKWVMELEESIIKNTIMHELIHCIPGCNNHGKEFKKYATYINEKLRYEIKTLGNKAEDYQKSNKEYKENEKYNYEIQCQECGQIFYRKRLQKNLTSKYRCGKCGGRLKAKKIQNIM